MKFLITGITGFAGPHLARHLLKEGHEVYGMVRNIAPYKKATVDGVEYLPADLRDINDIQDLFRLYKRFDGVFHLAAKTHPPTSFNEPVEYFETNALGTIYICEAIKTHQPDCVLMNCSSGEVYGANPEGTLISEETVIKPQSPYAVSKAAADMYCNERFKNGFLKGFTTRAFSHTGPGRPSNYSISSDAKQIAEIIKGKINPLIRVGNLDSKRVVMDVRDVVDVYSQLMMRYLEGSDQDVILNGDVFNIGGDDLHTMGFFLYKMLELFNVKAETVVDDKLYRKIDVPVVYPDSRKVRELLDWKPSIPIETTLKDLVEWWLERV